MTRWVLVFEDAGGRPPNRRIEMKEPRFGTMLSKADREPQRAARRDPNPAIPFCDTSYPQATKMEAIIYTLGLLLVVGVLLAPWVIR